MPYVGQTITDVFPTSVSLDTVTASTSLKTPLVEFTDGDNALSIADGGTVTFTQVPVNAGGGKVLQAVSSGNVTTSFSTSSETYQAMGVSVNITPTATSSKVLVFANVSGYFMYGGQSGSGDDGASGAIYRDSTEIYGSNQRIAYNRDTSAGSQELGIPLTLQVLDSPSTTSQVTYAIYMRAYSGSTINAYSHDKSIIAIEIGA